MAIRRRRAFEITEKNLSENSNCSAIYTSGFGDGTSSTFLGTSPLDTGTLASLLQTEHTPSDELLTETSTIAGSGVSAPPDTPDLTVLGPNTLDFTFDFSQVPGIGQALDFINDTVIPLLNTTLTDTISTTNQAIAGPNSAIDTVVNPVINIYNDCAGETICGGIIDGISRLLTGENAPSASDLDNPVPTISLDIARVQPISTTPTNTFNLPDATDPANLVAESLNGIFTG